VRTTPPVSRRSFLTYLLGLTGAVGLGGLTAPFVRYAYPVEATQVEPKLGVAFIDDVDILGEAVVFDYLERPAALIRLEDGTPKAFYLACTHFGCISRWLPDEKIFYCACHAGEFAPDGTVLAGPPPRPLVELNVVQEGEQLFVEGTVA
jgi:cytochrome b6-f complex iron-sulfur subunit